MEGKKKNGRKEAKVSKGSRSDFRLLMEYLGENRLAIILYIVTAFLFVAVCCLYHMENLGKLLYALLLTLVLWAGAGIRQGSRYVRKRRALEAVEREFQQSKILPLREALGRAGETEEEEEPETLEQQLIRLLETVENTRAWEQTAHEESQADRRDHFLMWAHQIKTPIAALKLLLEESGDCRNNFRMREELFKIEQYAEMALTIQRLESMASDLSLQEYELTPLLRQAVRKYSVLFINKGLQVEVPDEECLVLTDEKWFSFCLEQILSNAVKYTEKGKITLRLPEQDAEGSGLEGAEGTKGTAGNRVVLYIEDTGMGIRTEDLPRIFDKGFTGYNGRIDKRATGIGLYLCNRICRQLGISISVASSVGKGTRVALVIPVSDSRHVSA
ncbi:MAG: sensor histidine kinase [Firmicutes bacterium]|nr:sensor histidine kinase [Bacillota bacterium]